jgi:hypothetical protein
MTSIHQEHDTPWYRENSDFNSEWRKALRSNRSAWWRRRVRQLRASTRASEPSIGRSVQMLELKLWEVLLASQKISLKIRRIFR